MNKRNVETFMISAKAKAKSLGAKIGAGAGALMASGAALASGGGTSPGAAIAGELSSGKSEVLLVVAALAIIVGVLMLWRYVKRAS